MSSSAGEQSSTLIRNDKKRKRRYHRNVIAGQDPFQSDQSDSVILNPLQESVLPSNASTRPSTLPLLSGLTLAISTMDNNPNNNCDGIKHDQEHHPSDDQRFTYNGVQKKVNMLGARVSGQVHSKVTLLLCTHSALRGLATQRVRKAIRRGVPLVHVQWLYDCEMQGKRLSWNEYLLDAEAAAIVEKHRKNLSSVKSAMASRTSIEDESEIDDSEAGWTPAEDLGCCCICHENGTAEICPWCMDCHVRVLQAAPEGKVIINQQVTK